MTGQRQRAAAWHRFWSDTRDSRYLAAEAQHFVTNLVSVFTPHGTERVLDFGCGYGYVAQELAKHVAEVRMWDAVASILEAADRRVAAKNASPIDLREPGAIDTRFDMIVVNSVIQYMTLEELRLWKLTWRKLLTPTGVVVLSDVPSDEPSLLGETVNWFVFSFRNRVLGPALRFAVTDWSRYRRARAEAGLLALEKRAMVELARETGYSIEELPANLAYQQRRNSYILAPRAA